MIKPCRVSVAPRPLPSGWAAQRLPDPITLAPGLVDRHIRLLEASVLAIRPADCASSQRRWSRSRIGANGSAAAIRARTDHEPQGISPRRCEASHPTDSTPEGSRLSKPSGFQLISLFRSHQFRRPRNRRARATPLRTPFRVPAPRSTNEARARDQVSVVTVINTPPAPPSDVTRAPTTTAVPPSFLRDSSHLAEVHAARIRCRMPDPLGDSQAHRIAAARSLKPAGEAVSGRLDFPASEPFQLPSDRA